MKKSWVLLVPLCFCGLARAGDFNYDPFYIGGGLSSNSLDGFEDATGYQLFAGYNLDYMLGPVTTAVEAGYMDSGDFDLSLSAPGFSFSPPSVEAKGAWASVNLAYPINESFELLGRVGYDFGDDDGALLGIGIEYLPTTQFGIRGEYISRQVTESLQINVVYYPRWLK